jgi:hypothetical protein
MTALTRTKQGPFFLEDCLGEAGAKDVDAIIAHIGVCKGKLEASGGGSEPAAS